MAMHNNFDLKTTVNTDDRNVTVTVTYPLDPDDILSILGKVKTKTVRFKYSDADGFDSMPTYTSDLEDSWTEEILDDATHADGLNMGIPPEGSDARAFIDWYRNLTDHQRDMIEVSRAMHIVGRARISESTLAAARVFLYC